MVEYHEMRQVIILHGRNSRNTRGCAKKSILFLEMMCYNKNTDKLELSTNYQQRVLVLNLLAKLRVQDISVRDKEVHLTKLKLEKQK